jgi:hypothetical protein
MIQELLDNGTNEEHSKVEDSNKKIGQRLKRYTMINSYFDNYLRLNTKRFYYDFVKYTFIYTFIFIMFLYMTFSTKTFKEIFIIVLNEYGEMFKYLILSIMNKVNIELNEVLKDFMLVKDFKIPIYENVIRTSFTLEVIVSIVGILVLLYFLLILYQYLIQRDLFNSTLTQYFVPLWGLYFYYKRDTNKYIYVKLIKHMKQNNIISIYSNQILKNIFNLEEISNKEKIEIELTPKKFLHIYDYYILTYTINKNSVVKKEETKEKETIKKVKDNIDNELDLGYLDSVDIDSI